MKQKYWDWYENCVGLYGRWSWTYFLFGVIENIRGLVLKYCRNLHGDLFGLGGLWAKEYPIARRAPVVWGVQKHLQVPPKKSDGICQKHSSQNPQGSLFCKEAVKSLSLSAFKAFVSLIMSAPTSPQKKDQEVVLDVVKGKHFLSVNQKKMVMATTGALKFWKSAEG